MANPVNPEYRTGLHDQAVRDSQIAASQRIFCTTAAIVFSTTVTFIEVPTASKYRHGTHQQAIHDAQIAASQQVFAPQVNLPAGVGLGQGRDIAITQEERPPERFSSIKTNTATIASQAVQSPITHGWLQTYPQYPQDQLWSFTYSPPPGTAVPNVQRAFKFLPTFPQVFQDTAGTSSAFFRPAFIPSGFPQIDSVILESAEVGDGQEGMVQLRWSASLNATGYRLYINGVQQPAIITGQSYLVTGLVRDTPYVFNVVAVLAATDDSILSNPRPEEHGSNEVMTRTKYPWGDTNIQGYHITYKLGDKV